LSHLSRSLLTFNNAANRLIFPHRTVDICKYPGGGPRWPCLWVIRTPSSPPLPMKIMVFCAAAASRAGSPSENRPDYVHTPSLKPPLSKRAKRQPSLCPNRDFWEVPLPGELTVCFRDYIRAQHNTPFLPPQSDTLPTNSVCRPDSNSGASLAVHVPFPLACG
jgi:hypothetical protein